MNRDVALANAPRRGLRRRDAAVYVGVGETKFMEWVVKGIMPKPVRIDGVVVWDIRALDLAFDALADNAGGSGDTWADVA